METILSLFFSLPWEYILPILLSVFFIRLFYRAFKNTWPELYFSVSDYTSLFISFSPIRYFAFTLLPTLIISAFVLSIFLRTYQIQNLASLGLFIGLIHSVTTSGVALWKLLSNSKTIQTFYNRSFQILVHMISIFTITTSGYFGGVLGQQKFMIPFIPTWGIIDNLWAALISSILTVFLYRLYTNKYTSEEDLIEKSRASLSAKLVKYVNFVCEKHRAKRELVLAICITENIERPAWVRKLERIKSYFFRSGTYGVMQVAATNFIDDFQSVDRAVEKYFKGTDSISFSDGELKYQLSKYNSDSKFIELATAAFYELQPRV